MGKKLYLASPKMTTFRSIFFCPDILVWLEERLGKF